MGASISTAQSGSHTSTMPLYPARSSNYQLVPTCDHEVITPTPGDYAPTPYPPPERRRPLRGPPGWSQWCPPGGATGHGSGRWDWWPTTAANPVRCSFCGCLLHDGRVCSCGCSGARVSPSGPPWDGGGDGSGCNPNCSANDGGVRVKGKWGKDELDFRVGGRERCPCREMGGCDATHRMAKSRSRSSRRRRKEKKKENDDSGDERGRRRSRRDRHDERGVRSMSERVAALEEAKEWAKLSQFGRAPRMNRGNIPNFGSGFPDGPLPRQSGGTGGPGGMRRRTGQPMNQMMPDPNMVGADEDFGPRDDEFDEFGEDYDFDGEDRLDGPDMGQGLQPSGRRRPRQGMMGMPGRGRPDIGDLPGGTRPGMGDGRRGNGGMMEGLYEFDQMPMGRPGPRRGARGLGERRPRRPPRAGLGMMGRVPPPGNEFDETPFMMSGGRGPPNVGDGGWGEEMNHMDDDWESIEDEQAQQNRPTPKTNARPPPQMHPPPQTSPGRKPSRIPKPPVEPWSGIQSFRDPLWNLNSVLSPPGRGPPEGQPLPPSPSDIPPPPPPPPPPP